MNSVERQNNEVNEYGVEQQFERLYPDYDDSTSSMFHEKDTRRKKRIKREN